MASLAMVRPRWWNEETRFAWLAILPALAFFAVFVGFPVGYSFWLSFHEWNMMAATPTWIGLENYAALAGDEGFLRSLAQTALFTVGITACIVVFSLAMALLLDQKLRFIKLYRTVFYLPAVTSLVAIGIVWVWMFDPQYGLINQALKAIGVEGPLWLADTELALVSLIITAAWRNVGYFATVFLAGLQGIDDMYYEAARIDGAGPWASFWLITLPLLKSTIVFVVVLSVILSFQVFALVYVMTSGGPAGSTSVLVFYLYQQAFTYFRMGYASAIGFVLFAIIFVLTVLQFKAFGKPVET
ncbi:MAG: carbohydrate ABC transporter permease [Bacteroidota bacterium]|jgi:multiple sugar transport system permease protein